MTRITLPLLALTILAAPVAIAETKSYPAGDFTEISATAGVDVIFTQGAQTSIEVDQINGDFSDILIENDSGDLIISRVSFKDQRGWNKGVKVRRINGVTTVKVNGKKVPTYTVRVTAPTVDTLNASSSGFLIASTLDIGDMTASVSSSGDMELAGTSGATSFGVSSSGDLDAKALTTGDLEIKASSSADVYATSAGSRVSISSSSSADVELHSSSPANFTIKASSSSDVELDGQCTSLDVAASSSAGIDADKLLCADVNVSASSSADASVYASTAIIARASSGADIDVSGNPADRDVKDSSGGDINFD